MCARTINYSLYVIAVKVQVKIIKTKTKKNALNGVKILGARSDNLGQMDVPSEAFFSVLY